MSLRKFAQKLKHGIEWLVFKWQSPSKVSYDCSVCGYVGPFMDVRTSTGPRKDAKCPNCTALERHRIQILVVEKVLSEINPAQLKILHFAPEPFFQRYFSKVFGHYESADIAREGVDHHVDLQQLPFADKSYDVVFASHVLEHVADDIKAIAEIRRILKPNGIAILPVPIVADKTVEYCAANPHEAYHVRAPGIDYYQRYESYFSKVDRFSSDRLPAKHQLFICENRACWPTKKCPLRPAMQGDKHIDIVPVCYV